MSSGIYIGLMSGTSLDGIDGVIATVGDKRTDVVMLGHCHRSFDPALRSALMQLNTSGHDEIHRAAIASNALAAAYADIVKQLLTDSATKANQVVAIGAHGQTIRHRPGEFDGVGYTNQLFNGARMAELCGIDVVCDFRARDVAAGGQGAPLVPAFHHRMFHTPGIDRAVLNIGGIANLTLLDGDGHVGGFDCGPGNVLLDLWVHSWTGQPYDKAGEWAAGGIADESLLTRMLADPYFGRRPPKSTGRDHFNAAWLDGHLTAGNALPSAENARNIQTTLTRLTACAASDALSANLPNCRQLLVCGGGALNLHLLQNLQQSLPSADVTTVGEAEGIDNMQIEALAFAWMACAFVHRRSANCTAVTGAKGPRILGALYPA